MIYLAVLLAAGLLYFAAVAPVYFADHAPIVMAYHGDSRSLSQRLSVDLQLSSESLRSSRTPCTHRNAVRCTDWVLMFPCLALNEFMRTVANLACENELRFRSYRFYVPN